MARRKQEKLETQKKELEVSILIFWFLKIWQDLENADNEIEKNPIRLAELLQTWDFPNREELKKRTTKLKLKLGLISKQILVNISIERL